MKIIQIDGIKGLITAAFIGVCLFAGFVMFPGLVAMQLWNKYLVNLYMFPALNILQGVLLWGICAISYCIISKNKFAVSFKNTQDISDDEINSLLKNAKINAHMQMMNKIISQSDKFDTKKETEKSSTESENFISSPIASSQESLENKETKETEDKISSNN